MRVVALLWLTLLASSAALAAGMTVEQILELGEQQFAQGEYEQALRAFRAADNASAGEPCAPCEQALARTQLALGRYAAAAKRARAALTLGDSPEMRMVLGRALIQRAGAEIASAELVEAEAIFRELTKTGDPQAKLGLGETLLRMGRDEDATPILRVFLDTEPSQQDAANVRALLNRPYCGRESCLPEFSIQALDGSTIDNAALAGDVVLLDFWATWCTPCIDSIPYLKTLTKRHAEQPFRLVSLSADDDKEILELAIKHYSMDWTQAWDPERHTIGDRFRVHNFPTHVILDPRGVVRAQFSGWSAASSRKIDETIALLLDEAAR